MDVLPDRAEEPSVSVKGFGKSACEKTTITRKDFPAGRVGLLTSHHRTVIAPERAPRGVPFSRLQGRARLMGCSVLTQVLNSFGAETIMKQDKGIPPTDFDFYIGSWNISHKRLNERLSGCTEWTTFAGTCVTQKILGGYGNIDDHIIEIPTGTYRAFTLRSYDTNRRTWSIWWLDDRNPGHLDVPVVGTFKDHIGTFYAEDTIAGQPILVRFQWFSSNPDAPRWEQAFSPDGGRSWETNWIMEFTRASGDANAAT